MLIHGLCYFRRGVLYRSKLPGGVVEDQTGPYWQLVCASVNVCMCTCVFMYMCVCMRVCQHVCICTLKGSCAEIQGEVESVGFCGAVSSTHCLLTQRQRREVSGPLPPLPHPLDYSHVWEEAGLVF